MSDLLFENTNIASYFLWEYTKVDNVLSLWMCAEDIAHYLETKEIFSAREIEEIKDSGIYSYEYIKFVQHIAYCIYIYTDKLDAVYNWFAAEKLLRNTEWCVAITEIAKIYYDNKSNFDSLQGVRSDKVKKNHSNL